MWGGGIEIGCKNYKLILGGVLFKNKIRCLEAFVCKENNGSWGTSLVGVLGCQ